MMANFQKAKCSLVSYFHAVSYVVLIFIIACGLSVLLRSDSLFLFILAQVFVVLAALHLRLRDRVLNSPALVSVGIPLKDEPLRWETVISGLDALLAKKVEPLFLLQSLFFF